MKHLLRIFAFAVVISSCTKEKTYLYDVNDVTVRQPGSEKPNVKSTNEFVSIAYSDLFGKTISQNELLDLTLAYNSFGDKKLIEDMIIKNFLNNTTVIIPSPAEMRNDVPKFVTDTYKKFLNRLPDEYEKWYISNLVSSDTSVKPVHVYYSVMTSNEYRNY